MSRPTCKSLQRQVLELQHQLNQMKTTDDNEDVENDEQLYDQKRSVIYVQRDRRVPKFSGYNMNVEDWLEDVESCTREMSRQERADFIYSFLEGAAKEEIKYRSNGIRQNPSRIVKVLQDAFGGKDNITKLQKNFLDRVQRQGESLREYSYALMDLIRKVIRKDDSLIPNKDKSLCDQFSQNVQDVMLRKHLKRLVRSDPDITFLGLREEAIMWSEEEEINDPVPKVKVQVDSNVLKDQHSNDDKMNQLFAIVRKQSEQIDALTKTVNSKPSGQNRSYNEQRSSNLCFGCKRPGHKVADCPNKQGN